MLEMEDVLDEAENWGELRVARVGLANNFALNTIFLHGEGEQGQGGSLNGHSRGVSKINMIIANIELDI